jgi:phosphonate transport system substrate-binding protein
MVPVYRAVADAIGRRLDVETELVVETAYDRYAGDEHDLCFVCSLPYVVLEQRGIAPAVPIAAPVLKGRRYGGRPVYFSDVIAHRDSPVASFLDLRGRSWAYNEPLSQSGYGITRYHLVWLGETGGFFGDVIETGFHQESIRLVACGEVDAAAIDSHVLAVAMKQDPSLKDAVKVIDTLGPSTIQPIVASRRLRGELISEIRHILLSLHEDTIVKESLAQGLVKRFVPVDASSYDDIRRMLAACEAASFMEIK